MSLMTSVIQHVNGLRGIAVALVILYHYFPSLLSGGYVGVDVFFVISGYLITKVIVQAIHEKTFCFSNFYQKRILRLFPGLSAVLFCLIIVCAVVMTPPELAKLGQQVQAGVLFVSNFFYWSQEGYFDSSAIQKPLLHLWSLAVEEQFYLLWPLLVIAAFRYRIHPMIGCLSLCILSLCLNVILVDRHPSLVFYWPITRFWELAVGGLLALSHWGEFNSHRFQRLLQIKGSYAAWPALSILILIAFLYHDRLLYPGPYAIIPVAMACILLMWKENSHQLLNWKPLCHLGELSYSLYLWHWPLLSLTSLLVNHSLTATTKCLLLGITYGVSFVSHWYWEQVLRFHARRSFVLIGLGIAMLVFVLAGYKFKASEGWPSRSQMASLLNNAANFKRTAAKDEACSQFLAPYEHHFFYCRHSSVSGQPIVALIGDSHAHAAYPGLAKALDAKGYGTILMANSSCPMTLGYPIKGKTKQQDQECQKHMQEIVSILKAQKKIKTVIVMTRGPIYWTGRAPAFESDQLHGKHLTPQQWRLGMNRLYQSIQLHDRQIYYVVENPELKKLSEQCQAIPFRSLPSNCSLSTQQVLARQKTYKELLAQIPGLKVIDATKLFCPGVSCRWNSDEGMSYYADDNHLSVAGSEWLAEFLVPQLGLLPVKSP